MRLFTLMPALVLAATPALATSIGATSITLAPPSGDVVLSRAKMVRHGDTLAVRAMVHHAGQTAKVRQGELVARFERNGAPAQARARCDAHRWQEICMVALDGANLAEPSAIVLAFHPF